MNLRQQKLSDMTLEYGWLTTDLGKSCALVTLEFDRVVSRERVLDAVESFKHSLHFRPDGQKAIVAILHNEDPRKEIDVSESNRGMKRVAQFQGAVLADIQCEPQYVAMLLHPDYLELDQLISVVRNISHSVQKAGKNHELRKNIDRINGDVYTNIPKL